MREAALIFHTKHDFRGNLEQLTCEWEGPKDGVLRVSGELWEEFVPSTIPAGDKAVGQIVSIGPYKLRVFEFEEGWSRPIYHLVRVDSFLGNIKVIAYRLTRWLDLIYRRLIITASVWRLAEYRPECYPSWEDLYIVQRFSKWKTCFIKQLYKAVFKIGKLIPKSKLSRWWFFNLSTPLHAMIGKSVIRGRLK